MAFLDFTSRSKVTGVLHNAATPEKHQIETMAGGLALFDFDGDGILDLFLTNGAPQPSLEKTSPEWWNRLYKGVGDGSFTDVTEAAGLAGRGFDLGAAAGDFDNDGRPDLLVTGVRGSKLYRNEGLQFRDITEEAGLRDRQWAIAAAWFDYDRDGWLDLFIVRYVKWDPAREPFCGDPAGQFRTYCHPQYYEGFSNLLYRNNRDGTFTDVSAAAGIAGHVGKGMGVAVADFDLDGDLDIFVANDTVPNFLFRNDGGRFAEVAFDAGVALNDDGRALSSMGVEFRDLDNDGLEDIFITALANETFPWYRNLGRGRFVDLTYPSRLGAATLAYSGWGAGAYDFDNDGWKDVLTANGDVNDNTEKFSSGRSRQPCLLLRNRRGRSFEAEIISSPALHRGAAFGDLNNDGRVDAVISRIGQPPLILLNQYPPRPWIGLQLQGVLSNRDGIGARVRLIADGQPQWNRVTPSVGYASSSDVRVHFGLGGATKVDQIHIEWPSGIHQVLRNPPIGRYLKVREPRERAAEEPAPARSQAP
jgi:hypothetical protein